MTARAWQASPVTANTLTAGWRVALGAAHEALLANAACPTPTLPPKDLHARAARLTHERESVAALLEGQAKVEHVRLVRRLTLPTTTRRDLGLPPFVDACLFELDGVLAASDDLHAAAWAETFDSFLARRLERGSVHFSHYARFSRRADYADCLRGRPRLDGVHAFLAGRGITLPEGSPADPPAAETVHGLANRKNAVLLRRLAHQGVSAFAGSNRYLETVAAAGLACVVISASANTASILEHAGLADLVDFEVDGLAMNDLQLRAKPAPDALIAACDRLGIPPSRAAAFETTAAGIAAARAADIGLVVGITGSEDAPASLAVDVQVTDLADLLWFSTERGRRMSR
jgi:HAD superfamily hydrolase (TIGR01509 family)